MSTYFEKLDAEEQGKLKKCSNERLQARLVRTGLDEDTVFAYKREQLIETMASIMLGEAAAEGGAGAKPKCVWERELQLRERELQLREQERIEAARREAEAEKRWQAEFSLREAELRRQQEVDAARRKEESSLAGRTRKFADAIKHVFSGNANRKRGTAKLFRYSRKFVHIV